MTIRFTCAGCGSLLKIKEELAGTDGKCPKCKTDFVVPEPAAEADSEFEVETSGEPTEARSTIEKAAEKETEKVAEKLSEKTSEKTATKPAAKSKKAAAAGDDFDPADFLMGGDDSPRQSTRSKPASETVDPDEDDRRMGAESRPKKLSKPPTPGGGAADGISASAHAKEMMMKAMDESRAHAGDAPQKETRAGFDWAGLFREFGLKGGAAILGGLLLTYGLYIFFDGMMSSKLKLPRLAYVTGEVKLDGNPLPGATVYFAPTDAEISGTKKERPRTSFGITDEKGHYKMMYIQGIEGVAVGKCRVWLDLVGPKGQVIPANFTDGVLQVREVKSGNNDIKFEMSSNP